jgi:isoamylase
LRFTRMLIAVRKRHAALRRRGFFRGKVAPGQNDIDWHGLKPGQPDFGGQSQTLAFAIAGRYADREPDRDFYVACNAGGRALLFRVPTSPSTRPWRRLVDTMLPSPEDVVEEDHGPRVAAGSLYRVGPHSLVVLMSEG